MENMTWDNKIYCKQEYKYKFLKSLFTVRTKNNSIINHHHSYAHFIKDENFLFRQILVQLKYFHIITLNIFMDGEMITA